MKSNLLTSVLSGLLLPWLYFVFMDVASMGIYDNGVLVGEANQITGVLAFIEFYGVGESLLIYLKFGAVMFLFAFLICALNQFIRLKIETKS